MSLTPRGQRRDEDFPTWGRVDGALAVKVEEVEKPRALLLHAAVEETNGELGAVNVNAVNVRRLIMVRLKLTKPRITTHARQTGVRTSTVMSTRDEKDLDSPPSP